jgi:hypothetical protein
MHPCCAAPPLVSRRSPHLAAIHDSPLNSQLTSLIPPLATATCILFHVPRQEYIGVCSTPNSHKKNNNVFFLATNTSYIWCSRKNKHLEYYFPKISWGKREKNLHWLSSCALIPFAASLPPMGQQMNRVGSVESCGH